LLALSPNFPGTKTARVMSFLRAYKRVIVFGLVFAYSAFLLIHPDEDGRFLGLFHFGILVMLIASQFFWIRRVRELGKKLISGDRWRKGLGAVGLMVYFFLLAFNALTWNTESNKGSDLTLRAALLDAPFWLWFVGSMLGFLIAILLWIADRLARGLIWASKKLIIPHGPEPPSPGRRHFLEQTAKVVSAAPFVAGAYGLFYGRLNLETTYQRIKLRGLPKAFEGFRIVQLSDLHISPFMTAEEIRRYVAIANQLKAELVVLTGDFLTWDPTAEGAVVQALSALKAPFGVFGCLGNHEIYTETQDSITRLFAAQRTYILRQARMPVQVGVDALNLIGVDFQGRHGPPLPTNAYLRGVERLMMPDTVNILLTHNPNSFDRAAQLGIDLSLAGHTHGGQLSLEFAHRGLAVGHWDYPYFSGWYERNGSQLYVNRGIGTIGFPIRLGARPEITVLELSRT
jgi:predicted MPP superfamily phosphohydrolase